MPSQQAGEDPTSIRDRVTAARSIQHQRFKKQLTVNNNAAMESRLLKQHCALSAPTLDLLARPWKISTLALEPTIAS